MFTGLYRSLRIPLTLAIAAVIAEPAVAQQGRSQAGDARARHLAELGRLPEVGDVVATDILNYHRHGIPLPHAGEKIALDLRWDVPQHARHGQAVLQIGIATPRYHDTSHIGPLNLGIVIDCSGSMAEANKMSRVKQGLMRFLRGLRPSDRIALIVYSNEARVLLPSKRLGDGEAHRAAIRRLEPGGSTNLYDGLMLGYSEVSEHRSSEATNRVILLTDGIANVGVTEPERIARESKRRNGEGVDLSTIGVGTDFNRELLATLAKSGRGMFHFVADEKDIDKVFVQELQSLVAPIARDVVLEIRHGSGVVMKRVFGAEMRRGERGARARMDDFNYGLTQVVLARFQQSDSSDDTFACDVDVRLSFRPEGSRQRKTIRRSTSFLDAVRAARATDFEVRKNYTIAVMADALEKMAEDCQRSQYRDADRRLARALELVRHEYPTTKDKDIVRVRKMLKQYRKTLSAHIERFRRL